MQCRVLPFLMLCPILAGCGLGPTPLAEVWDRLEPDSTYNMTVQVKNAVYCELKRAAIDMRNIQNWPVRTYNGKAVSRDVDGPLPDHWGVLVQLTLQADEKSTLNPGVVFKTPMHDAPVNFKGEVVGAPALISAVTYGAKSLPQSYSLGLGGQLSSQNIRYHKYNFYWTARDLGTPITEGSSCRPDYFDGKPISSSSPFLDAQNLGIRDWLSSAIRVIDFQRSSRLNDDGEGDPLGVQGSGSDTSNYSDKFVIVSSANVSPTWSLVRIGTPTGPLFDANRTRTHELVMTVGAGSFKYVTDPKSKRAQVVNVGPAATTRDSHNIAINGSSVGNALR